MKLLLAAVLVALVGLAPPARAETGDRAITYVGTIRNRADLAAAGLGTAGHWFPQLAAAAPVTGAKTSDNVRDALPSWVGAFNHTESPIDPGCTEVGAIERGCLPTYLFRTFSQDGPARSAGGFEHWATITIPGGETGIAGAIVDPHTFVDGEPNNNNTMNRIQLRDGVPGSFVIGIVTDTTTGEHDAGRVEIRGNAGVLDQDQSVAATQVEPTGAPGAADLRGNGVPDIHLFRVDGFVAGDYLKLRLRGLTSPASFSGLLFDVPTDGSSR